MTTTAGTVLIALAVIICATVSVCVGSITSDQWLGVVGASGGGGGLLHVLGIASNAGRSSGG